MPGLCQAAANIENIAKNAGKVSLMPRLALGLDSSTQSLTALAVDIDKKETVYKVSLDYRAEPGLSAFGIREDYILPPEEEGEACQPVKMYFASLDLIFERLAREFPEHSLAMKDIVVINTSGQQHGHVLLNSRAGECFDRLKEECVSEKDLAGILGKALALPFARIWRTSNTAHEAALVRERVGGKEEIIRITGSDAPLRFSAFGIRKTAFAYPEKYAETSAIHQISSLVPAVLTGNVDISLDYGNACGTSLMDYQARCWSERLLIALAQDMPGGVASLKVKLPPLDSGKKIVGKVAGYFVRKYGLSTECAVGIGSGDNPQTKVLVEGSLLSLGTSFVIMVETDGRTFDSRGYANAMYDAIDRPFSFGCRTNGALRWDEVRSQYRFAKNDYAPAEEALEKTPPGNLGRLFLWQAETESFPVSGKFGPLRIGYDNDNFAADYAGIIESTLAAVYCHSQHFMAPGDTLYVSGGATGSLEVMRRAAAIWKRAVVPVEAGGAALGAAVSGSCAWLLARGEKIDEGRYCASFLKKREKIRPRREDIEVYHGEGGYLARFKAEEEKHLAL